MKTEMTIRKGQLANEWQIDWQAAAGDDGQHIKLSIKTTFAHQHPRTCDLERSILEIAVKTLTESLGSMPPYQDKPARSEQVKLPS